MPIATTPSSTATAELYFKGFSEAALAFLNENIDKRNLTEVEKILIVIANLSDIGPFESHLDFLVDLTSLLGTQHVDPSAFIKSTFFGKSLHLLTSLCSRSDLIRVVLRDKMKLLLILSDILTWIPATSVEKIIKTLDLIRIIAVGVTMPRLEAYLLDLIPKLIEFMDHKNCILTYHCFCIVVSLCWKSKQVSKFTISLMDEAKRTKLIQKMTDAPKTQILLSQLNFCLSRLSLSNHTAALSWGGEKFQERLTKIVEALCIAYEEDDFPFLSCVNDFFFEIRPLQTIPLKAASLIAHVQQMLLVLDFSRENGCCNKEFFKFFRQLYQLTDLDSSLTMVEDITRAINTQLTSDRCLTNETETILLFRDVAMSISKNSSIMDNNQMQNLRLILDHIIGLLANISFSYNLTEDLSSQRTRVVALDTLALLCDVDEQWCNVIERFVTPSQVMERAAAVIETFPSNEDPLLTGILLLTKKLTVSRIPSNNTSTESEDGKPTKKSWKEVFQLIYLGEGYNSKELLLKRLRSEYCPQTEQEKILAILSENVQNLRKIFDCEELKGKNEECTKEIQFSFFHPANCCREEFESIQTVIEKVTKCLTENSLNNTNLGDIMMLTDFRIRNQSRTIDNLKKSLSLSDKRIAEQNKQIACLNEEIDRLLSLSQKGFQMAHSAEMETEDIRTQYESEQQHVSQFKQKMEEACKEKDEKIALMEHENKKYIEKIHKYKELSEELQNTIEEHLKTQEELQTKLKAESKAKSDLTAALEKREEKLKKKEKLLEDELGHREKLATELESTKKELASLQSLTKSQQQALSKKEKQLQEQGEELDRYRKIQEQIFNLSKISK